MMDEVISENEGYVNLSERMAALELALEDARYWRLTTGTEFEFSREGLRQICEITNVMYLKNPLIQRGVNVQRDYVWGQGVGVHAEPEWAEEAVRAFWEDPKNQAELTSLQSLGEKEVDLQLEGNLFFVFFGNAERQNVTATKNVATRSVVTRNADSSNTTWVRTIPFEEVGEIVTDPEDRKSPWFYRRIWNEERRDFGTGAPVIVSREAFYPDWNYDGERPATIGGVEVRWDEPVYHVKVGGRGRMQFGMSEIYAAIDWALAYKAFLEDWATIVRAYSRFAWQMTTQGGKGGIAAAKAKLGTTVTTSSDETNPAPVTGSVFIAGEGKRMEPIRTAGATTSAEDGRRLLLMVAAVMGLPETFFGDVSVGTLATGKSLDRPTELKMRMRQSFWKDVLVKILRWVVGGNEDVKILVTFPPILEHDVSASVSAVVQAATLGNYQLAGMIDEKTITRMLLTALGETDVEGVMERLESEKPLRREEREENPTKSVRDEGEGMESEIAAANGEIAAAKNAASQKALAMTGEGEGYVEAARELREAIRGLIRTTEALRGAV